MARRLKQRRKPRARVPRTRDARSVVPSTQQIVQGAQDLWRESTPANRLLFGIGIMVCMSVLAGIVNTIIHVSFVFAFMLVPVLLAPVIMTVMAGVTAFAIFAFFTAGVGFAFVGTPMFMLAVLAKMLLPVFGAVGLGGLVFVNVLRAGGRAVGWFQSPDADEFDDDYDDDDDDDDGDDEYKPFSVDSELEDFDRVLRRRARYSRDSLDIGAWSISQVVDELDICGLSHYRQLFIDEQIDGRTLLSLTDDDIRTEFSSTMPLGDRRRLSRLVTSLQNRM